MLNLLITVISLIAFVYSLLNNNIDDVSASIAESPQKAAELAITLAGSMSLWGGLMRIAEKSGLTDIINKAVSKLLAPLFRGLDAAGETMKAISMNVTANLLGLGNAATPLGILALQKLSHENESEAKRKDIAMLILLNTCSVQLVPSTVSALRNKHGSLSPWDCTLPIITNSLIALIIGIVAVNVVFCRKRK